MAVVALVLYALIVSSMMSCGQKYTIVSLTLRIPKAACAFFDRHADDADVAEIREASALDARRAAELPAADEVIRELV